jgi:microcystin-dependent protein
MTKPYGRIYKNKTNVSIDALDLYNVWPVGSIYISVNNTNPSTYFGGTWVSFGAGRCLVGVDTSQTEFNTVQKTGGEKRHTLTVNEMPSHNHHFFRGTDGTNYFGVTGKEPNGGSPYQVDTSSAGGGQSHNNLQPYITVYMWKRTA